MSKVPLWKFSAVCDLLIELTQKEIIQWSVTATEAIYCCTFTTANRSTVISLSIEKRVLKDRNPATETNPSEFVLTIQHNGHTHRTMQLCYEDRRSHLGDLWESICEKLKEQTPTEFSEAETAEKLCEILEGIKNQIPVYKNTKN